MISYGYDIIDIIAVSPYKHGPFDSRAKDVGENASAEAMKNLSKLKNEPDMAYLKCKLREWYHEAQRPLRKQPADDDEEPMGGCAGAGGGGTAGEAEAEDGGDTGNGGAAMGITLY
jgi:hypothetical protein